MSKAEEKVGLTSHGIDDRAQRRESFGINRVNDERVYTDQHECQ